MQEFNISNVDGRLLRVFLTVYDHNSISRAAAELDLNQSTVSHAIEKFRKVLSDPLFVKSGRGIVATDTARMLAPRIRQILAALEGLVLREGFDPQSEHKPFVIATNVTEMLTDIRNLLGLLWQAAPDIPVRFMELGSRQNIEPVLESGRADIVLTVRAARYSSVIRRETFKTDDLVVFYDPEIRAAVATAEDYCAAPHGALDFGGLRKSTVETALDALGLSRRVKLSASNAYSLGALMKGTNLITTMQSSLAETAFSRLAHCPAPITLPTLGFDMVWHRRAEESERNRWLRDQIRNARPRT